MKRLGLILSLFLMWPVVSYGYLYASLRGHEDDLRVDGRDVHIVVAGYGNELGMSTYQMAVSRAKKLKENFPNDRVIILGSTSFHQSDINHRTTPERLERDYDISVPADFKAGGRYEYMTTAPLTADDFTASILNAITRPSSMEAFYRNSGAVSLTDVSNAIRSGQIERAGQIRSLDFITHSSPVAGIFLHNSESYYRQVSANEASVARSRGVEVLEENGRYFVQESIPADQRSITAASSQISALNGMFTDDAYVNMAGCSGGFGVVEDLSRALGVPVSGTANGSEVYVMGQDGDYYYNYPETNPFENRPLSDSLYSMIGHEFGANSDNAPPMNFKPAIGLYNGYWGRLNSGTNFTMTACVVRPDNHAEDLARCEMGMARRIEDALTQSNSNSNRYEITDSMTTAEKTAVATEKYKSFLNTLKENMCPDGRGISYYEERYATVREQCFRAIDVLGALSINCRVQASELAEARSSQSLQDKFPERYKDACSRLADEYIEKHKHFVPLLDREGKTLFCDLSGCRVRLVGCDVTSQERRECWDERVTALRSSFPQHNNIFSDPACYSSDNGPIQCLRRMFCTDCQSGSTNQTFREQKAPYDRCLNSKRCEIDEDVTRASNQNNPTFMNYIQHYLNGYVKLEQYRRGDLVLDSDRPPVMPLMNASPSSHNYSPAAGVQ